MSDKPQYTIPDDLKVTIAKFLALQSLATDPGQQLMITAAVMRYVRLGIYMKYNEMPGRLMPDNERYTNRTYQQAFASGREFYQESMQMYNKGQEFWGQALLRCADIADDMATIAAIENMLDYRQLDFNLTQASFGPSMLDIEEAAQQKEREARLAAPAVGMVGMKGGPRL